MSEDVAQLLHRTSVPSMTLDPYAVLRGGKRRRVRRRLSTGGFALVLVAGFAVAVTQAGWWPTQQTSVAGQSVEHHVNLTVPGSDGAAQQFQVTVGRADADPDVRSVRLLRPTSAGAQQVIVTSPVPGSGETRLEVSRTGDPAVLIVADSPTTSKVTLTLSDGTQVDSPLTPVPDTRLSVAVVANVHRSKLQGPMTVTVTP